MYRTDTEPSEGNLMTPVNRKDGFSLRLTEYSPDGKATKTMYNLDGEKVELKKK